MRTHTRLTSIPAPGSLATRRPSGRTVAVALGLMLAGCPPQLPPPAPESVEALAVVLDASLSSREELVTRCDEMVDRVERLVASSDADRVDVTALATGGGRTGGEPQRILDWQSLSFQTGAFADPAAVAAAREGQLGAMRERCAAALRPADTSPIYQAVARALGGLRAHCDELGRQGMACVARSLAIHSDLQDSVEPALRLRLSAARSGSKRDARRAQKTAVPVLDGAGVDVTCCGIAETRGGARNKPLPPAFVRDLWAEILGAAMPVSCDALCARKETALSDQTHGNTSVHDSP